MYSSKADKLGEGKKQALKEKIDNNMEAMTKIHREINRVNIIYHHFLYEFWILRGVDKRTELNEKYEKAIEKQKQQINVLKDQYLKLSSADENQLKLLEVEISLGELSYRRQSQYKSRFLEGLVNEMFPQRQLNIQKEGKSVDEFCDCRKKLLEQKNDNNIDTIYKLCRQKNHLLRIINCLISQVWLLQGQDESLKLNKLDKQIIEDKKKINEIKEDFSLHLLSADEDELKLLEEEVNLEEMILKRRIQEQPRLLEVYREDIRNFEDYIFEQQRLNNPKDESSMSSKINEIGEKRRKLFQQKADKNIETMMKLYQERYHLEQATQNLFYECTLLRGEDTSHLTQISSSEVEHIQELNKRKENIYLRLSSEDEDEIRMVEEELLMDELLLSTRIHFEPKFLERLENEKQKLDNYIIQQKQLNEKKEEKSLTSKLKDCWKSFIDRL